MVKIGHVPEIIEVKAALESLSRDGVVLRWELPYENLLTRLDAALFFVEFSANEQQGLAWHELARYGELLYGPNEDHALSELPYHFEFSSTREGAPDRIL